MKMSIPTHTANTLTIEVFSSLSKKGQIEALDALFVSIRSPYAKTCYKRAIAKDCGDALWIAKGLIKAVKNTARIGKIREGYRKVTPFAVDPGNTGKAYTRAIKIEDAFRGMWHEAIKN